MSLYRDRTCCLTAVDGRVLVPKLHRPQGLWPRLLGLLVRPPLGPDEGLWLDPCGGIHTWGLRYPIDVLFLDRELRVLRIVRGVGPWRMVFAPRGTLSVIELSAASSTATMLGRGDRLRVRAATSDDLPQDC
jgi:uncharacterized protein